MKNTTIAAGIAGAAAAGGIAVAAARRTGDQTAEHEVNDGLRRHLSDMVTLLNEVHTTVRRQLDSDLFDAAPDARTTVEDLERLLDAHLMTLDGELEVIGGALRPGLMAAAGNIAGTAGAFVGRFRTEPASRAIRDDFVAASLVSVSYAMLQSSATEYGGHTLADTLGLCIDQLAPLVDQLRERAPETVRAEITARREAREADDAGPGAHSASTNGAGPHGDDAVTFADMQPGEAS